MKHQLSVRLHGNPVGILEQTSTGKMRFFYNESAAEIISIGMPIREQAYDEIRCEAYFGGLLPESETVRKIIGKRYGVSANNSFALLKAIGYDCAGAISFHATDEPVNLQRVFPLSGRIIDDDELYKHIRELPKNPLFLGFDGLRLSLAGVQDKAAVCVIDNKIALPDQGCPTTYILKPAIPGFEYIIENEYFCLKLANKIGLSAPHVEIRQIKDISFLLIERYDRRVQNNQIERIHQEDFCQALGITSAKKYQNEGGPALKNCFDLLKKTTHPAIDRNKLVAMMIFNFLIGNRDAHGKNFSLLHKNQSQISLAPFYDLLCTEVYPSLSRKMAMKIGSKYESNKVLSRHWERCCIEINYSFPALKKLIRTQGESILRAATQEKEQLFQINRNTSIVDKIIDILKQRISHTARQFE